MDLIKIYKIYLNKNSSKKSKKEYLFLFVVRFRKKIKLGVNLRTVRWAVTANMSIWKSLNGEFCEGVWPWESEHGKRSSETESTLLYQTNLQKYCEKEPKLTKYVLIKNYCLVTVQYFQLLTVNYAHSAKSHSTKNKIPQTYF